MVKRDVLILLSCSSALALTINRDLHNYHSRNEPAVANSTNSLLANSTEALSVNSTDFSHFNFTGFFDDDDVVDLCATELLDCYPDEGNDNATIASKNITKRDNSNLKGPSGENDQVVRLGPVELEAIGKQAGVEIKDLSGAEAGGKSQVPKRSKFQETEVIKPVDQDSADAVLKEALTSTGARESAQEILKRPISTQGKISIKTLFKWGPAAVKAVKNLFVTHLFSAAEGTKANPAPQIIVTTETGALKEIVDTNKFPTEQLEKMADDVASGKRSPNAMRQFFEKYLGVNNLYKEKLSAQVSSVFKQQNTILTKIKELTGNDIVDGQGKVISNLGDEHQKKVNSWAEQKTKIIQTRLMASIKSILPKFDAKIQQLQNGEKSFKIPEPSVVTELRNKVTQAEDDVKVSKSKLAEYESQLQDAKDKLRTTTMTNLDKSQEDLLSLVAEVKTETKFDEKTTNVAEESKNFEQLKDKLFQAKMDFSLSTETGRKECRQFFENHIQNLKNIQKSSQAAKTFEIKSLEPETSEEKTQEQKSNEATEKVDGSKVKGVNEGTKEGNRVQEPAAGNEEGPSPPEPHDAVPQGEPDPTNGEPKPAAGPDVTQPKTPSTLNLPKLPATGGKGG